VVEGAQTGSGCAGWFKGAQGDLARVLGGSSAARDQDFGPLSLRASGCDVRTQATDFRPKPLKIGPNAKGLVAGPGAASPATMGKHRQISHENALARFLTL
jgi:hypothetical protein